MEKPAALNGLDYRESNTLVALLERWNGSCEPPNPMHSLWIKCIDLGYIKRADGRCMFERFKDSHVVLTPAGREAVVAYRERMAPWKEYVAQQQAEQPAPAM